MKLVVGLGNPGAEYRDTRHNAGFQVIDALARRWGLEQWREAFESLTTKTTRGGEAVLLAKPLTFMNLSGRAVVALAGFYKVSLEDLLVITDDVALPTGRLRARRGGSDGGHNGLKSISQSLGTQSFARLRVGVGRGDSTSTAGQVLGRPGMVDHVLGRFRPDERETISAAVLRAAEASELFIAEGIERVMNVFNAADAKHAGNDGKQNGTQELDPAR
jgi:PTH1 family peptidyl-tRNA hydrolase